MNHRYADCQNSDPTDLGDCACMGTRSDLIREIHGLESALHRAEQVVKAAKKLEEDGYTMSGRLWDSLAAYEAGQ